ncbi:tape measure protein [Hungatella hathewayi]|jgi:tape measure domain-containing protein|uniref:tape measure protein n=1 Tax=Hungatella hathewayi TaxID=154046 RepID=UPI000E4DE21A|nr:tape measure protein [Hungatella hathewayi]RGY93564.1 phage tail protein [Hungatella hathewayi]
MPTLSAMFRLMDGYSSQIDKMMNKTNTATEKMLKASKAADKVNDSVTKAGNGSEAASPKMTKFNNSLSDTERKANKANGSLKTLIGTVVSLAAVKKGMDLVDDYTNAAARLRMVNDDNQTPAELQDKVFDAANRSRGSYTDMAGAVAKMNLLAGDSFTSNDEAIGFTELLQKSLKVSGAGTSEQQSAFLQLTQAMAAGKLQGDEFRSVMENAPMVADAIAKYMGKSKGELKELSSDGLITADIIKNAMFTAADDINDKFAEMPMTFADVGQLMANNALEAFGPTMEKLNTLLNSSGAQTLLAALNEGIAAIAEGANWLIDAFIRGDPIVRTFFAVAIIMAGLWAGQMLVAAGATLAAHWPLILIIATLGAIVLALTSTGVTFADIFSFIGGLLGAFYGTGYNIISSLWNLFISFAEFLANVFHHPIQAIVNLFIGMATSVLTIIKDIATAIDGVFGSNLAGAVGGFSTKLKSWGDSFKADDYVSLDDMRMDTKDIAATAEAWGEKGKGVGDFIDKWDFGSALEIDPNAGGIDYSQFATAGNPATVKGTGKGGAVKVENEEDIEWMRRLAERDYIARFSQNTLAPNIKVEFSGPITKEADTNNIMSHVSEQLKEMIATAPEGVPA